jgi:hypothetical protein
VQLRFDPIDNEVYGRKSRNWHPRFGCGIAAKLFKYKYERHVYTLPKKDWDGGVDAGTKFCGRLWCDSSLRIMLCEPCAVKHGLKW